MLEIVNVGWNGIHLKGMVGERVKRIMYMGEIRCFKDGRDKLKGGGGGRSLNI